MRSGNLKRKVLIESLTVTKDGFGGEVKIWTTYKEVYASIEPLRGEELFTSQQTYNKVITRIRIRYTDGIRSEMRVNYNGRIFEIETVLNIFENNKELQLLCSEVV